MDMKKVPKLPKEFMLGIQQEIHKCISVYSIGIGIMLNEVDHRKIFSGLIASGTLVAINGKLGIMTARHVAARCGRPNMYISLLIKDCPHNLGDMCDRFNIVFSDSPGDSSQEDGPDWAFMIPPPSIVGWLKANKGFWQLNDWKSKLQDYPIGEGKGFWIIKGYPGEFVKEIGPKGGFKEVVKAKGFMAAYGHSKSVQDGEYDYIEIKVGETGDDGTKPPLNSYGGISGGGLWWASVEGDSDSDLKLRHVVYTGIPFYEICKSGKITGIKCHGWRSIYYTIPQKIRKSR